MSSCDFAGRDDYCFLNQLQLTAPDEHFVKFLSLL